MEVEPGTSAIELTPIETISNNNSAVVLNDQIRLSNSKEKRCARQISERINDLTIKSNQVGIDIPANDYTAKDLSKNITIMFIQHGILRRHGMKTMLWLAKKYSNLFYKMMILNFPGPIPLSTLLLLYWRALQLAFLTCYFQLMILSSFQNVGMKFCIMDVYFPFLT